MNKVKNNMGIQGHPEVPNLEPKDRIYKYLGGSAVVAWIPSKSGKNSPLLWYCEENNTNYELRYARNQQSPLAQFQDDNAILEPIAFSDGLLRVSKQNPALQMFLELHPAKGRLFVEVDPAADAEQELELMDLEDQAIDLAKEIYADLDAAEILYESLYNKKPSKLTSSEMKRDIRRYAANNPKKFIAIAEKANSTSEALIEKFVKGKFIQFRNNSSEVWYNLPGNKKKMMNVPQDEDPHKALAEFFQTDEGVEAIRSIESVMATM